MPVKVIVPNKNYNELFFGVRFKNGEAIFEDEKYGKAIASRMGYKVEAIKKQAKKAPNKPKKDDKKEV